jgi:hypothetical protein
MTSPVLSMQLTRLPWLKDKIHQWMIENNMPIPQEANPIDEIKSKLLHPLHNATYHALPPAAYQSSSGIHCCSKAPRAGLAAAPAAQLPTPSCCCCPPAATVSEEVAAWMSDIRSDTGYKRASAVAELVRHLRKWEDLDTEEERGVQAGKRLAVRKVLIDDMVWMIRYGDTYLQVGAAS